MASQKVVHLTDASFDGEISSGYSLVDFWAEWCGPCRALAPTIDELAETYDGKVKICKVDVDNNQEVASRYGIRGIPTIILYKDGKQVNIFTGNDPQRIKSMVAQAVSN
ncbi:MAG: thioredoxin [SAR324 cluster bacterium]|nr:thioredoxin [SAR324 cluster bacterium]MBF0349918.1 thioredoxin [SAR324 cluster bacterium]